MVKFVWFPVNHFLEFSSPIFDLVRLHFNGSNGVICFVYSEPHSGKQEEGEAGGHVDKISAQNEPLTTALWWFFRWPDLDDEEEFASDIKTMMHNISWDEFREREFNNVVFKVPIQFVFSALLPWYIPKFQQKIRSLHSRREIQQR